MIDINVLVCYFNARQEIITTRQMASNFIEQAKDDYTQKTGKDLHCYSDKHKYINNQTGKVVTCIDNQFFHK